MEAQPTLRGATRRPVAGTVVWVTTSRRSRFQVLVSDAKRGFVRGYEPTSELGRSGEVPAFRDLFRTAMREAVRASVRQQRSGIGPGSDDSLAGPIFVGLLVGPIGSEPIFAALIPSESGRRWFEPSWLLAVADSAFAAVEIAVTVRRGKHDRVVALVVNAAAATTIVLRGAVAASGRELGWQRGGLVASFDHEHAQLPVLGAALAVAVALPAIVGSPTGLTSRGGTRWGRAARDVRALAPILAIQISRHAAAATQRVRRDVEGEIVDEERAKLARDMHDIVAHELSVVAVQAAGAEAVIAVDPARAARALGDIQRAARQGLVELRRLLAIIRDARPTESAPLPGIAALDDVIDGSRRAGMHVDANIDGGLEALPAASALAVHRIVQESLTNALRHAGTGAHVTVRVRRADETVTIEVVDDGDGDRSGLALSGGQHGVIGMRERAVLFGGTFEAGPRPSLPGWRVLAALPAPREGAPS